MSSFFAQHPRRLIPTQGFMQNRYPSHLYMTFLNTHTNTRAEQHTGSCKTETPFLSYDLQHTYQHIHRNTQTRFHAIQIFFHFYMTFLNTQKHTGGATHWFMQYLFIFTRPATHILTHTLQHIDNGSCNTDIRSPLRPSTHSNTQPEQHTGSCNTLSP